MLVSTGGISATIGAAIVRVGGMAWQWFGMAEAGWCGRCGGAQLVGVVKPTWQTRYALHIVHTNTMQVK